MVNELICKGCPHYSERDEPFLKISVTVKNKKTLKESLEQLVEGEILEGENAYYCEKCDKKVNTLKRATIKRLPNVLVVSLNRFEYDLETLQRYKVNDYFEFPNTLDMEPYCQHKIGKDDLLREM